MSKNIMLIAGGSDPAGTEIDGNHDSQYNRDNSFGNLLAKKTNYTPINIAISGSANAGIVRSVIDWFNNQNIKEFENIFVLVGWADGIRMEVPFYEKTMYKNNWDHFVNHYSDTHDDYIRINLAWAGYLDREKEFIKPYHRFMVENELLLEILSANYILQLQYYLKMLNIPYLFVNTLNMFTQNHVTLNWYKKQIDGVRFLHFDNNNESFYYKYKNLGYNNPKAKYFHHDEIPHALYSEHLYNYIINNKLIDP